MILRDRVEHVREQGGPVLGSMRGHVYYRSAGLEDIGSGTIRLVENLAAMTEPYEWAEFQYLRHRGRDYEIRSVMPRYRNGKLHHVTLNLRIES